MCAASSCQKIRKFASSWREEGCRDPRMGEPSSTADAIAERTAEAAAAASPPSASSSSASGAVRRRQSMRDAHASKGTPPPSDRARAHP